MIAGRRRITDGDVIVAGWRLLQVGFDRRRRASIRRRLSPIDLVRDRVVEP